MIISDSKNHALSMNSFQELKYFIVKTNKDNKQDPERPWFRNYRKQARLPFVWIYQKFLKLNSYILAQKIDLPAEITNINNGQ